MSDLRRFSDLRSRFSDLNTVFLGYPIFLMWGWEHGLQLGVFYAD